MVGLISILIELILVVVLVKFIEVIGLGWTCLGMGILYAASAFITGGGILYSFIQGLCMGFLAYIGAIVALMLIEVFGFFGRIIVGVIFFLIIASAIAVIL